MRVRMTARQWMINWVLRGEDVDSVMDVKFQ